MGTNNTRIGGVDELRGLLALGIILFHFFAEGGLYGTMATNNATSDWGSIIVYIFFIVSGICIFKSNPEPKSPLFYYKRWKSIYPSFYVAWIAVYILRIVTTGSFNPDNASLWTIPLTIFGVDGYFLYLGTNFYLIGEWFLGAIIFLYLLYPVVVRLFNRSPIGLFLTLLFLTILIAYSDIFVIIDARNIVCCLTGFTIGMLFGIREDLLKNNIVLLFSLVLSILLLIVPLSLWIPTILLILTLSTSLFLLLRFLLEQCSKTSIIYHMGGGLKYIGTISYQVFLVQHIVIIIFYKIFHPNCFLVFTVSALGVCVIVILVAKLLSVITNKLLKYRFIKRLDDYFYLKNG
jgi:peptidoglycan/LPS O-acetylase OafA/YrhL